VIVLDSVITHTSTWFLDREIHQLVDEQNFHNHSEAIYNMDKTEVLLDPCPPKIKAD